MILYLTFYHFFLKTIKIFSLLNSESGKVILILNFTLPRHLTYGQSKQKQEVFMRFKQVILGMGLLYATCALESAITWQTGIPITVGSAVNATTAQIMGRNPDIHGTSKPTFASLNSPKTPSGPVQASFPSGQTPVGNATLPSDATPNFTAGTLTDTETYPPDAAGCVGPTQYLLLANGLVRSFDKKTGLQDNILNTSSVAFFQSVLPAGAGVSNPRIIYDRPNNTWIATALSYTSTTSQLLFAHSNGGIISSQTVWSFYICQPSSIAPARANPNAYVDFDTLGYDSNALYIGVNVFDNTTLNFINSDIFIIRKSDFLTGTLTVTPFRDMIDPITSVGMRSPRGVVNFDSSATQGLYIGDNAAQFGSLIFRIVNTPGGTPQLSSNVLFDVLSTAYPVRVPHLGNHGPAGLLSVLDDRLSTPHIRDNLLYACQTVGVDMNGACPVNPSLIVADGVRWYEIDVSDFTNPVSKQIGTLSSYQQNADSAPYYWVGSIMSNGLHNVVVGSSVAGNHSYINAAYAKRPWNWPLGSLQTPYVYTKSTTSYNPPDNAWGTYTVATIDPDDNMTVWLVEQYCNATDSYALQVVRVLSPPPPQCFTSTPSTVMSGQSSVTLTITPVGTTGRSFYDPPSDFLKHLKVNIDNVIVNSVTVVNPLELNVNISTVGSFPGRKSITITNPDGQQAFVPNILQVL